MGEGTTMLCSIINLSLSLYRDGELPKFLASGVKRHLARCPRCSEALQEIDAVAARLEAWKKSDVPEHLPKPVVDKIKEYERERQGEVPQVVYKPARSSLSHEIIFNRKPAYAFARAAVAAVLVMALTLTMLPDRSIAQAVEISGAVLVAQPGQNSWNGVATNMKIYPGMKFRFTGNKDYIDLRIARSNEVIRLKKVAQKGSEPRRTITLDVRSGGVRVRSLDRTKATKFKVRTPDRVIDIQGDICMVTMVTENGQKRINIEEMNG